MIGFTNKRHRFVSKQLEIRNAVLRVIASRVVTVISLAETWASLWVPGDVVFCRAFSIKLAIFQRFYQRAPAITITKTEMRTLRSMSTTNTLNLNNTFQVVHFFQFRCRHIVRLKVDKFDWNGNALLKHQFNLLTRVTKRSGSLASKSTWNLRSRSHYRTWSLRPK